MIRLLVADDDALVRSGLTTLLRAEPDIEVVGEAADGIEAVRRARELDPDVVLMDVRMPKMDGLEATKALVARSPDRPRVLVVTTFEHDEYVYDALRAGASGFVLKRVQPEELAVAVHTVKTHVARVLAKLEVRDRTQAVVLAYETGFVQPGE